MVFFKIVVSFILTFLYFSYANIKKGVYSQGTVCVVVALESQAEARGSQAGDFKTYK